MVYAWHQALVPSCLILFCSVFPQGDEMRSSGVCVERTATWGPQAPQPGLPWSCTCLCQFTCIAKGKSDGWKTAPKRQHWNKLSSKSCRCTLGVPTQPGLLRLSPWQLTLSNPCSTRPTMGSLGHVSWHLPCDNLLPQTQSVSFREL